MYDRDQLFIDGKWVPPDSDAVISVISPHSEAVIGHAACAGPADVNRAVDALRSGGRALAVERTVGGMSRGDIYAGDDPLIGDGDDGVSGPTLRQKR